MAADDFEKFSEIAPEYGDLATVFERVANDSDLDLTKKSEWWLPWKWFLRGADWEEILDEIELDEEFDEEE